MGKITHDQPDPHPRPPNPHPKPLLVTFLINPPMGRAGTTSKLGSRRPLYKMAAHGRTPRGRDGATQCTGFDRDPFTYVTHLVFIYNASRPVGINIL
jgi:hypothetical protein